MRDRGWPEQSLTLEVRVPALPSRGGSELVRRLFAPLGWEVRRTPIALDPQIGPWGASPYVDLHLRGTMTVSDALSQLYVLIPVLDDSKHYWIGTDEIDKPLRAGGAWLVEHPEREEITRRYLGHHRELMTGAVARLAEIDDLGPGYVADRSVDESRATPLAQLRRTAVVAALHTRGRGVGGGSRLR